MPQRIATKPKPETKTAAKPDVTKKAGAAKPSQISKKEAPASQAQALASPSPLSTKKREVVYKEVGVLLCQGAKALTAEKAKEMLGWREESENIKFGDDYLFKDMHEKKIRCFHNISNRPFRRGDCLVIAQEILRGRYRLNGESMIIGKTRLTLSCQHRLIALVLAEQLWKKHPENYPFWKGKAPVIETVVVVGIEEDDETINTLDTGKSRSFADVLFRDSEIRAKFPKVKKIKEFLQIARVLNYAVRLLWERTGVNEDAHAPKATHAELRSFIDRHPTILKCVAHIIEEDGKSKLISDHYISLGYASALMYLMGAAATDRGGTAENRGYIDAENPSEKLVDWTLLPLATKFWSMLAANKDAQVLVLRQALAAIYRDETEEEGACGFRDERMAVLILAWSQFSEGRKLTLADLTPVYHEDAEQGYRVLAQHPTVGGIDCGKVVKSTDDDE